MTQSFFSVISQVQGDTKKRSSPKIYKLPKFDLHSHKTSATLGQACVADISKVSSLYYKNSLFHWRSKNMLQMSSPALQVLGVDCHRPLVVVLEPEWSNDAMF